MKDEVSANRQDCKQELVGWGWGMSKDREGRAHTLFQEQPCLLLYPQGGLLMFK